MTWEPITEEAIWDKLSAAQERLTVQQAGLWRAIRIPPERWEQKPWGDEGGGFWAVGVIGRIVVWFNDIEDGFICSEYNQYGIINSYWCNQNELEHAIQGIINFINTGRDIGPLLGPPQKIPLD